MTGTERTRGGSSSAQPRGWIFAIPLSVALLLGSVFYWGLSNSTDDLPSTMIGREVPEFDLPPVKGRSLGLSDGDLYGEVSLVNVFASWCVACREEHPNFMALEQSGAVPIHGLNYKDQPADAAEWLDTLGDPYTRTGADIDGRVAIDWGVYGVPETFVVGADGTIAYKHIGPVTQADLDRKILPLVRELQAAAKEKRNPG